MPSFSRDIVLSMVLAGSCILVTCDDESGELRGEVPGRVALKQCKASRDISRRKYIE